jgi:cystathionine gamma-synthase
MSTEHIETSCVHAGREPDAATAAVAPPIHLATTFERDADGRYPRGYHYTRAGNPNRAALETCVAELEGGAAAAAFASGSAASLAVFELLRAGDHIVAPNEAYYGTLLQLREIAQSRGIRVDFVDATDAAAIERAMTPATRLVWIETPSNPRLGVTDIERAARSAHARGAWLACDNTFATPVCQRPLALGADLVMHSSTKYFGGHSDVMGGILVTRENGALAASLREWQKLAGAVPSPFDCWLIRRSIATLALRVRASCAGAQRVAEFLKTHPGVEQVFYPGLSDHPNHAVAARQMRGFGGMLSLCVRGDAARAFEVAARVHLFTRATSLGGVESFIEHRASMEAPGTATPPNLLRLSIGLEHVDDLIADLAQALGN